MNPIDERVLYLLGGVVLGWLLRWLWSAKPGRQTAAVPPPEPGTIIVTPAPPVPQAHPQAARVQEPASSRLIDVGAARAAGFNIKHADDLTIIEGIGPKTDDLLRSHGIDSFTHLARLQAGDLVDILDQGGPSFRLTNPATWSEQALLATENRWADLKRLQKDMIDGVMPGGNP